MLKLLGLISIILIGQKSWGALTSSSPCQNFTKVNVLDFGANGSSTSADNFAAFQNALDYASKCIIHTVHVPAGTYYFIPAPQNNVNSRGIYISTGTTLEGERSSTGTLASVLKIAPSSNNTFASFFRAQNQDNIVINNLAFVGNGVYLRNSDAAHSLNDSAGVAFTFYADSTLNRALNHVLVQSSSFSNFAGYAWVSILNMNANYPIRDVVITSNQFTSQPGNIGDAAHHWFSSFAIGIQGAETNKLGVIDNVTITTNSIEGTHIRGGISIWSGVTNTTITRNTISNVGADANYNTLTGTDLTTEKNAGFGAYAISVYSNSYQVGGGGLDPDQIHITHNTIISPRSCGVYTASANTIYIQYNSISGQTDTSNGTIPKGAIALNSPKSAVVTDNTISKSYIGIATVNPLYGSGTSIANNTISNILANGFGLHITLPRIYNTNAVFNIKIDGADSHGIQQPGTTAVYARFMGGYIYLKDIVTMHTQTKIKAVDTNKNPLTSVAAINTASISPWGVSISNMWSCSSYSPIATQIGSTNPISYGCSNMTIF